MASPARSSWWLWIAFAGLIAGHLAIGFRHFPASALASSGLPLKGDTPRYLATIDSTERLGGPGMDPLAMAGYPAGTWNSIGKKGYEILAGLIPAGSLAWRFYVVLLAVTLLSPLILTASIVGLAKVPARIALPVSLMVWHLDGQVAYFWQFGNGLYPGTCALIPLVVGLGHRAMTPRWGWAVVFVGLLLGWIVYAHTVVVVAVVPALIVMALVMAVAGKTVRPLIVLTIIGTIAGLIAAPWLVDLLQTRSDCVPQPQQWFQAGVKHFAFDLLSDRSFGRPYDRNIFLHALAVAGAAGIWLSGIRGTVAAIGLTGFWCLIVAYTFSFVPALRSVQPYRFLVPAVLCLSIPACVALRTAWLVVGVSPPASRFVMALLAAVLLPAFTASVLDQFQSPAPFGLSAPERQMLDDIAVLPSQGRIACQHETVAHMVPLLTGKPVLGGLNDQAFVKHRFAGFLADGRFFGRLPCDWPVAELATVLAAYNVEYFVVNSVDWFDYLHARPALAVPVLVRPDYHIYCVPGQHNWFVRGTGVVHWERDRLRIETADRELVLKLHYSERYFYSDGVTAAAETVVPDDPVQFLKLTVPPGVTAFEVRFRR